MKKSCILLVFEPANSIYNYKTGHFFINVLIKNTPLKEDEKQINILKYWLL